MQSITNPLEITWGEVMNWKKNRTEEKLSKNTLSKQFDND